MKILFQVRLLLSSSGQQVSLNFFDNFEDAINYINPLVRHPDFIVELSIKEVQIL